MYPARPYCASTGRWLSRDPIEEEGDIDLYVFVSNDSINSWDILGLTDVSKNAKSITQAQSGIWGWTDLESSCQKPPKLKVTDSGWSGVGVTNDSQ
jgi:hypothetical protein